MTQEELKAIFVAALREAGIKASPEEEELAAAVFAREMTTRS